MRSRLRTSLGYSALRSGSPYSAWLWSGALGLSVLAGSWVAGSAEDLATPLAMLAGLAWLMVLFSISPERLFLGWLFVASLLQESADRTTIGHPLVLGLALAPTLVMALHTLSRPARHGGIRWFDLLPAGYLLLVVGSLVLTGSEFGDDLLGTTKSIYVTVVIGIVVYYFVVFGPGRTIAPERIVRVILAVAALQAALAIIEFFSGWNVWGDVAWKGELSRSIGTLSSPVLLGSFLGVGVVCALAVLFWGGPAPLRPASVLVLVLAGPGLLATLTRAPLIAAVTVASLMLLLNRRSRVPGLAALVVAGVAIALVWGSLASTDTFRERYAVADTARTRVYLQQASFELAVKRPLLGWGYRSFDEVKSLATIDTEEGVIAVSAQTSHNTFLTVLVELGLVGLVAFLTTWLVIFGRSVKGLIRRSRSGWIYAIAVGSLLVYALNAATIDMRFFGYLPAIVWLTAAMARVALDAEAKGVRHSD